MHYGRDWLPEPDCHLIHPVSFGAFVCVWLLYSHLSPASSRADSLIHPARLRLLDFSFPHGAGSFTQDAGTHASDTQKN